MEFKLVKVVSSKKYVDKNGDEKPYVNFALDCNGYFIFIKPAFTDGYKTLNLLAEVKTLEEVYHPENKKKGAK